MNGTRIDDTDSSEAITVSGPSADWGPHIDAAKSSVNGVNGR